MRLNYVQCVCPKCGSKKFMRLLEGKNVGELDVKCINCNSYFYPATLFTLDAPGEKTNREMLNGMSDEDFARWLAYESEPSEVRKMLKNGAFDTREDAFLWWLRKKYKEA